MYCCHGHLCVCLSVCLSLDAFLHYYTDPDVTLGEWYGVTPSYAPFGSYAVGFVAMATYEPNAKCQRGHLYLIAVTLTLVRQKVIHPPAAFLNSHCSSVRTFVWKFGRKAYRRNIRIVFRYPGRWPIS